MEPSSESNVLAFSDVLISALDDPPWGSGPVFPVGMLPAVVWSPSMPMRHLRVAGDRLVWVAQGNESTDVWSVAIDEIEHVAPVQIATFPVRVREYETDDGGIETARDPVHVTALLIDNGQIYLERTDGVARISIAGDAPTTVIPLERRLTFGEGRDVQHLAVFGGQVFVLGTVYAHAGPENSRNYLVQIAPGAPAKLWEVPITGLSMEGTLHLVGARDQLWFLCDTRLHRYRDGQVTALGVVGLYRLLAADGDLFACTRDAHLLALDPETGALRSVLLLKCPGEVESMIRVGGWICLAAWNGDQTTILAVRTDGSESRCIARIDGNANDLCSDGRFLYWVCHIRAGGCVCRTPLGRDGAPLPVVASPPDVVRPRRAPPTEPPGHATIRGGRGLPSPEPADEGMHALVYESLVAALDSTAAAPSADHPLLVPWCGWLLLALVRYRAAQLEVLRGLGSGIILRPEPTERRCWMWTDAKLTWSSREQHAMTFRIHEVGDGIHAMIDPDWLNAWDFTGYIEKQRERCPIAARLWRWLPGRSLIAKLAGWRAIQLGGAEDSSGGIPMLRLPEKLESLAQDPLALAGIADEDVPRIACWLGDPEIGCPDDASWCQRLQQRHRRMIDELIDLGEYSVLYALPELFHGAELTHAYDYLLAACAVTDIFVVEVVVTVLRKHPEAPPSRVLRRVVAEVTPMHDLGWFGCALPYLRERGIELATVRAKLRMLAGLEQPLLGGPSWTPKLEAMLAALMLEPEAGRRILASSLRHESSHAVENAASLLIAIAAPWCAAMLQAAQGASPHQEILDAALSWLGLRTTSTPPDGQLSWMVSWARSRLGELREQERAALLVDGVDN